MAINTANIRYISNGEPHDAEVYNRPMKDLVIETDISLEATLAATVDPTSLLEKILTVDGVGSGLDADLLDGINSSSFIRNDIPQQKTSGALTFNDNVYCNYGTNNDVENYWNGTDYYTDINGGGNWYLRDGNTANATRFTFDIDTGNLTTTGDVSITGTVSASDVSTTTLTATGDVSTGALSATGNVSTTATFIETSDERLKTDITKIDDGLSKVNQISGYTFNKGDTRHAGVIAQEIQKVLPEAVSERDDGYLAVAYTNIIGLLVESIKDLDKKVTALENSK
jgi:hypothetical protein